MIKTLNSQILEGVNMTIIQDSMKNIAKHIKETEKSLHGIKETTGELPIIKMDEKTTKRKPTTG